MKMFCNYCNKLTKTKFVQRDFEPLRKFCKHCGFEKMDTEKDQS